MVSSKYGSAWGDLCGEVEYPWEAEDDRKKRGEAKSPFFTGRRC